MSVERETRLIWHLVHWQNCLKSYTENTCTTYLLTQGDCAIVYHSPFKHSFKKFTRALWCKTWLVPGVLKDLAPYLPPPAICLRQLLRNEQVYNDDCSVAALYFPISNDHVSGWALIYMNFVTNRNLQAMMFSRAKMNSGQSKYHSGVFASYQKHNKEF